MTKSQSDLYQESRRRIFWLLERCGDHRSVFGPYTPAELKREGGPRYMVVRGTGLRDGSTMSPGAMNPVFGSNRIWEADPSDQTKFTR